MNVLSIYRPCVRLTSPCFVEQVQFRRVKMSNKRAFIKRVGINKMPLSNRPKRVGKEKVTITVNNSTSVRSAIFIKEFSLFPDTRALRNVRKTYPAMYTDNVKPSTAICYSWPRFIYISSIIGLNARTIARRLFEGERSEKDAKFNRYLKS